MSAPQSLLSEVQHQKFLYELKHLVSVTPENYECFYIELLQRAAELMQQKSKEIFTLGLARAITVLKHRRAYMLPPGTNAETCYQQQDAWAYALFTAALLKDYEHNPDLLTLAKQLIPDAGIQRLSHYKNIYQEWCDFFDNQADINNIIVAIIQKAEVALSIKSASAEITTCGAIASMLYPTTRLSEPIIEQATTPISASDDTEEKELPLTDHFINWLRQAIAKEKLPINTVKSLVHRVADGMLLVMPELLENFIAENPKAVTEEVANDFENNWQQLTNNNDYFVAAEKSGFQHRYCFGNWQSRRVFIGLVLKPQHLFSSDKIPNININLTSDPMDDIST
jgi:hypothetical protein